MKNAERYISVLKNTIIEMSQVHKNVPNKLAQRAKQLNKKAERLLLQLDLITEVNKVQILAEYINYLYMSENFNELISKNESNLDVFSTIFALLGVSNIDYVDIKLEPLLNKLKLYKMYHEDKDNLIGKVLVSLVQVYRAYEIAIRPTTHRQDSQFASDVSAQFVLTYIKVGEGIKIPDSCAKVIDVNKLMLTHSLSKNLLDNLENTLDELTKINGYTEVNVTSNESLYVEQVIKDLLESIVSNDAGQVILNQHQLSKLTHAVVNVIPWYNNIEALLIEAGHTSEKSERLLLKYLADLMPVSVLGYYVFMNELANAATLDGGVQVQLLNTQYGIANVDGKPLSQNERWSTTLSEIQRYVKELISLNSLTYKQNELINSFELKLENAKLDLMSIHKDDKHLIPLFNMAVKIKLNYKQDVV